MQRIVSILKELMHLMRHSPLKTPLKVVYWVLRGTLRQNLRYHRARRIILASGLFDPDYYLRTYPFVTEEPLHHYLTTGAAQKCNPRQLFDSVFYVSLQPDISNPLLHYLQYGALDGKDPHPLFNSAFYLEQCPEGTIAGMNPLRHYLTFGARQGKDPHPLFDSSFYRERNPDIAATESNLLEHYLERGFKEGRDPHWMFDSSFYLERNPDVSASGMNPLVHFVRFGAGELRDPHPLFDSSFYVSTQRDVWQDGMNLLEHFVRYGAEEGRSPHFLFDFNAYLTVHPELENFRSAAKHAGLGVLLQSHRNPQHETTPMSKFIQNHSAPSPHGTDLSLSVVIPTHNRLDVLEGTLQRCLEVSRQLPIDFVVVSDGCTDNTLDRLQWYTQRFDSVRFAAIEKAGPAVARNVGAARARGDLIMFIGDDIRPVDSEFFVAHLRAHEKLPELGTVIEGHVQWPNHANFHVNSVMRLIQGSGAQQFAYHYMQPHCFFDWRHFWSANLSVKRALVKDWTKDGFSPAFRGAAYEDIELAYRINKSQDIRVYYAAESVGEHFHPHNLSSFMKRQIHAGEMARTLVDLHPELASVVHVNELDAALRSVPDPNHGFLLPEFENVIRGYKSWGAIMEAHQELGTQEWHDAYLNALFQLCHGEGYLNTFSSKGGNLAEGYRVLLGRFRQQIAASGSSAPILHAIALY